MRPPAKSSHSLRDPVLAPYPLALGLDLTPKLGLHDDDNKHLFLRLLFLYKLDLYSQIVIRNGNNLPSIIVRYFSEKKFNEKRE